MSVSLEVFTAVAKVLSKRHGNRLLPQEVFNEIIATLGEAERVYLTAPLAPKEGKAKKPASPAP